jgi:peptidoglycan/LPS O-acetylase OafA/YrhL
LTGLRFVAAMMVVVGHGASSVMVDMPNLTKFLNPLSGGAMPLFFTLSGFVMWLNYAGAFTDGIERRALRNFAVARFARLWPMYFVTLVIALASIAYFRKATPETVPGALLFLFGIQGWIPAVGNTMATFTLPTVAHYWSISTEMFLYLVFPLMCMPIAPLRRVKGIICVVLIGIALYIEIHHLLLSNNAAIKAVVAPTLSDGDAMGWVGYYSPYIHLFEFGAGCLACRAYELLRPIEATKTERYIACALACFSMAVFVSDLLMYPFITSFGSRFWTVALFMRTAPVLPMAFLIFYVSRYTGLLSRALSTRTMEIGGDASYSTYLLHPQLSWIWIALAHRVLPAWVPTPISFVGMLVWTVGVAMLTYRIIEVPART